eukprot:3573522-Lingulodinium_polyedra.AAC.1
MRDTGGDSGTTDGRTGSQTGIAQQAAEGTENYVETDMDDEEGNADEMREGTLHGSLDPIAIPVGDTSDEDGQAQGGPSATSWYCSGQTGGLQEET